MLQAFYRTVLILCFTLAVSLYLPVPIEAQEKSIVQTEMELKSIYGLEKLIALNRLTPHFQNLNSRKAIKYGRQAVVLGENIFIETNVAVQESDLKHLLQAYFQMGEVWFKRGHYFQAQENLQAALSLSEEIGDYTYREENIEYLEEIDGFISSGDIKEDFFTKTFGDLNLGEVVIEAKRDIGIESEISLGRSLEKKGDFRSAIEHYDKAIKILSDKGDSERISQIQIKIATLLDSLDEYMEARDYLDEVIFDHEIELLKSSDIEEVARTQDRFVRTERPEKRIPEPIPMDKESLKNLSDRYEKEKNYEKSLEYFKLYQELTLKMEADSIETEAENKQKEAEIQLLKQQKQIADLNYEVIEKEKARLIELRNKSLVIAFLVLIVTLVTLFFYFSKKREHKRLSIAYRDLDKTKDKLEGAEQRIVKLLRQQVSGEVARELLMSSTDKPVEKLFVCIMFLDIRDFTNLAEKLSPEELIAYQNNVFGFMIDIVQHHHGNINQLLGDGFMATFGAPVSHGNDCQNAFLAANEILKEVKERSDAGVIKKTQIGIGLHAGYVVTGNVGNEARKQYSVTGNPVIIASRVEQLNKEYKSQLIITEDVYKHLERPVSLTQPFLEVEVKGRSNPIRILKIA